MTMLPRIAERAFNRPLWVDGRMADVVASVLGPRMNLTVNVSAQGDADAPPPRQPARDPMVTKSGIMVLPVVGGLAHRGDAFDAECGGLMSYTLLNNRLVAALENPDVRGILLDIDSPGGEAGGCFEFGDTILDARKQKPIYAVANARACSAAYMIGSSANKFYCTPSGEVGSIGVCWLHVDLSAALADAGVVTTWLFKGRHKVDGNPYEKLSKAARDDFMKSIGESYDLFVAQVAARRPMSPEAIQQTEARTFGADEATALGLVDGKLSFQGALEALESELNQARTPGAILNTTSGGSMTTQAPAAPAAVDNTAAIDAARAEGYTAGRADASAILGSEEAKGRETMAAALAADASQTPEKAVALLKSAPRASAAAPEKPGSRIDRAMEAEAPKVDATGGDVDEREARLAQIRSAGKAASSNRYRRA